MIMSPPRGVARLLALASLTSLLACQDDPAAPPPPEPVPTALQFSAQPPLRVTVGTTASLEVRVLDQMGRPMPSETASLESRDTTTLTVDSAGSLEGVAGGETWVVARHGTLRDSLAVSVRYHLLPGEAVIRIVHDGAGREIRLEPIVETSIDVLGSDDRDWTLLFLADGSLFSAGTVAAVTLDRLRPGDHPLTPVGAEILEEPFADYPSPALVVGASTDDGDAVFYLPRAGSRLVLDEARPATAWGETGRVTGRAVVHAAVYRSGRDASGELGYVDTGETATVYLDLRLEPELLPLGQASYTLDGGPSQGSYTEQDAEWDSWATPGGRIWIGSGYPDVRIDLAELRSGTLPLDSVGPQDWLPSGTRLEAHTGQGPVGLATGGAVEVERHVAPTATTWGEIAGTVEADLLYWSSGQPVDSAGISLEFVVPLPSFEHRSAAAARAAAGAPLPTIRDGTAPSLLLRKGAGHR